MKKLFLSLFLSTLLYPKSQALIIGINNDGLQGAVNDANGIQEVMTYQGVRSTVLLNKQATKKNIIYHLKGLVNQLNKGDRFYFFFSGHGTSLLDPNFKTLIDSDKKLLSLLENSGGLIPWDFKSRDAYNTIISAKRDLAPIFKKIDKTKKAFGMIMIDACFSGMSFKDFNTNMHKNIPIKTKLHFKNNAYPYKNIVYLASTVMSDWASEDKNHRPYRGFFSRALEHCLYKNNRVNHLKRCVNSYPMAQSIVVYSRNKSASLFDRYHLNHRYKDIVVVPKKKPLVDELFSMATTESDIEIVATQHNGIERKVYSPSSPLHLTLKTKKEGYLVFMSFGEKEEKLKLHYPKYEARKLFVTQNESLGEFEAEEPFGEEYLIAFLVDLETSKKISKIYKQNKGNLRSDTSIREVIGLLKGQSGSSLKLRSVGE